VHQPASHTKSTVQERLLLAGKRLFALHGFEHTTTASIAHESGTSESQLVKYFQNKEGLLEAIFESGWQQLGFVFVAASIASEPEERLRIIFELILKTLGEDRDLRHLMLFEGRRVRSKSSEVMLTAGYFRLVKEVEALASDVLAKGRLKKKISPRAVASALIGMLESMLRDQAVAERNLGKSQPTSEEIRTMFRLLIAAIEAPI
jgi:AcrR family transcriptional regulator